MADYYDQQKAKVQIYYALLERGWKCYGFKEDDSDSMTDYFSPAHWDGIAEKDGYILLIDQYNTSYSGYKKTQRTSNFDYEKYNKIKALAEKGATEGERSAARFQMEKMEQKREDSIKVLEQYPTFSHANPKRCNWHIEKDGQIIAKGTGAYAVWCGWNQKEETRAKTSAFVDRIETEINNNTQLESEVVKVVKKVIKPVVVEKEITSKYDINENTVFIMNVPYTNNHNKGNLYQFNRNIGTDYNYFVFYKLGKKLQQLTGDTAGNTFHLSIEKLLEMLKKGHISLVELQEVEEVSEKVVYNKSARKQKANTNPDFALTGEVEETEEVAAEQTQQTEQMEEVTAENQATRKQLWAIHYATKLDTRELKITKEKASDLIGKSMKGENITNVIKSLLGMETEQTPEETKTPENDRNTIIIDRLHYPLVVKRGDKVNLFWHNKGFEEITVYSISHAEQTINGYDLGFIYPLHETTYTKDEVEYQAENIIDYSGDLLYEMTMKTGVKAWEMNAEQKEKYKNELKQIINESGIKITVSIISYLIRQNSYHVLLESLETIVKEEQGLIKPKATTPEKDYNKVIERIEKAVESAENKLEALSGDYLTNTWKRQQEENSRQNKRDSLRFEIRFLEYLKERAENKTITDFEIGLITGSIHDELNYYYRQLHTYKRDIEYPVINHKFDLDGWWNLEVPKKQKRLSKLGITNTKQLYEAVEQYKNILQQIETPKNPKQEQIRQLESEVKFRKIPGYFPTPKTIVEQMLELADIREGEKILEPSAGNGNIADAITAAGVKPDVIEYNFTLQNILELKGYNVIESDFTQYQGYNQYDKIVMNPPFENLQDIDHVLHAYKCLKENGRIVAIMSESPFFRQDKKAVYFREWLFDKGYSIDLEAGSFKDSGTGVKTRIVIIDKLEQDQQQTA